MSSCVRHILVPLVLFHFLQLLLHPFLLTVIRQIMSIIVQWFILVPESAARIPVTQSPQSERERMSDFESNTFLSLSFPFFSIRDCLVTCLNLSSQVNDYRLGKSELYARTTNKIRLTELLFSFSLLLIHCVVKQSLPVIRCVEMQCN